MLTIRHNRMPAPDKSDKIATPAAVMKKPIVQPKVVKVPMQIGEILSEVSARHNCTPEDILGCSRLKHIVNARKEFACMMHFKRMYTPSRIAIIMNMDHTSVKHMLGLRKASKDSYQSLREKFS